MATIFFSMAGEGRGHATRARALVEQLRDHHRLVLFAPDDAYRLLAPRYANTDVDVRRIPCPRFHYHGHRLNYIKTMSHGAAYLWNLPRVVKVLERAIDRERPDLCITDFEPALPRAAGRRGVPFVSLNHQHFLVVSDLTSLPRHVRKHVGYMGWVVHAYHQGQSETIVSSFFFPPLKPQYKNVVQVGSMLRPEVLQAQRSTGGHLCVYLRPLAASTRSLAALKECGRECRVYGLGARPADGNL
ncbi:MAG: glycosyltransferase family protein, partial [Planctomycetia bacterium]